MALETRFAVPGRKDTCDRRGINFEMVVKEIQQEEQVIDKPFDRWDEKPLDELIGHILVRFHEAHRRELPRLIEMARKVEAVHGTRSDCPHG